MRFVRRIASSVIALAAMAGGVAQARDIFVNNIGGDDRYTGRSEKLEGTFEGPVLTLTKALRTAQAGDHIYLTDTGTPYREAVAVQAGKNSGLGPDLPLVIDGRGAVLDGSTPIPDDAWEFVANETFRYAPNVKSHQVLLLDGQPAIRVPTLRGQQDIPKLAPLQWCLLNGMIYFRVEPLRLPAQYFPACAGEWTGITLYEVRDVVIRDCVVRGFAFDGINAHDNAFNIRLENVLCRDNGRSGFSIGGASRVTLQQCEATFNHAVQFRTEGYSHAVLRDCLLDDATAPARSSDGGEVIVENTAPSPAPGT